ncbi:MAG: aminoglycoside phosphotransferase family protein [Anaerolineaceae bacterium]|nr:aminoglycoside phosphotransferase family protein [Anaerolineaceae bacterium]
MSMTNAIQNMVAALVGSVPDDLHVTLRSPLTHQSNRLYDVKHQDQHWIAKEYLHPDECKQSSQREFDALHVLQDIDVAPIPIHLEAARDTHGPVVLYEYMAGEMWDRYSPTTEELAQLAQVWLKVNDIPIDKLWPSKGMKRPLEGWISQAENILQEYLQWTEVRFPQGVTAAQLCIQAWTKCHRLVSEIQQLVTVYCFCKSDPRFGNVIDRPDHRLGLIDWEDSGLRDTAIDVADVMTHPNQEDLVSYDQWQAFLQPYLSERSKQDADLEKRVHLYSAILPFFWLLTMIRREQQRIHKEHEAEGVFNELPASVRLPRYLARTLAWPSMDFSDQLDQVKELRFFPTPGRM